MEKLLQSTSLLYLVGLGPSRSHRHFEADAKAAPKGAVCSGFTSLGEFLGPIRAGGQSTD